jgi:hypothetical protein
MFSPLMMSRERDRKNIIVFSIKNEQIKQELIRYLNELKKTINEIKSLKKK